MANKGEFELNVSKQKKKSSKRGAVISFAIVIFLTALALSISFYSAGEGDFIKGVLTINDALRNADPFWMLIITGMMALSYIVEGLVIFVFCRLFTRKYYYHQGLANAMIGAYYNNVTPGANGGQVMQIYTMKKQGIEVSNAASIMVMWFILYQVSLIIFDLLALIFEWNDIMSIKSLRIQNFELFGWDGTIPMMPLIVLGFLVNLGAIGGLLLMSYSRIFHKFIMGPGIGFLAKIKILRNPTKTRDNLKVQVENFKTELKRLQSNIPVTILIIFFFLLILAIRFSIPYFSGLALNAYPLNEGFRIDRLWDACFRSAFHQMVSGLIPIPGGAGISELVYTSMFGQFFVETYAVTETGLTIIRTVSANIMATQILWRTATFYFVVLASGVVAAFYRSRNKEGVPSSNRQAFLDLKSESSGEKKAYIETLYETKQLSRREISKRLDETSLANWGLMTGDDYLGPVSQKDKKKTANMPNNEE